MINLCAISVETRGTFQCQVTEDLLMQLQAGCQLMLDVGGRDSALRSRQAFRRLEHRSCVASLHCRSST